MSAVLEIARKYVAGGVSVFPICLGGQNGWKAPAAALLPQEMDPDTGKYRRTWNPFRAAPPTDADLVRWFGVADPPGLAAVCGAVSGGLEVIDFDNESEATFAAWCAAVGTAGEDILTRISVVRTPKPGYHVWLRCEARPVAGNAKLASDPSKPPRERTLIETRGEGGYALLPGCPAGCHETGRAYEHLDGPALWDLRPLTAAERDTLVIAAHALDRTPPPPPPKEYAPRAPGQGLPPGADYDRRHSPLDVLIPAGWAVARVCGDVTYVTRPGKDGGVSGSVGKVRGADGSPLFKPFTTSTEFEAGEGKLYGAARCHAILRHGGDWGAAVKDLAARGYGEQRPARVQPASTPDLSGEPATEGPDGKLLRVASIADLKRAGAEIRWLWEGWIAQGVLTALAAEGGCGKTRFVADLIRRVRKGLEWPDGQGMTAPPDSKALWVVSDNHHDEMVTLAETFGIDDAVMINAWAEEPYGGVSLECDEDFKALDARCHIVKPLFVVVDTVGNATDRNLSKQEDARAFYQPLQVIARKHRCAVLCLTHLNAAGQFLGRRVQEKVRVALKMSKPDPAQQDRRALEVHKSNSKKPDPLGVTMGDGGNEYDFDPPQAPLGEPGAGGDQGGGKAVEWLRRRLQGGPAKVVELIDEADTAGVSRPSLYRAKKTLNVEESDGKPKWWTLPGTGGLTV